MSTFSQNLATLPAVEGIERLELFESDSSIPIGTLYNKPGQAGSLAVYNHIAAKFGCINPEGAREALALYGEHTADAQAHPGKHPNIDRLFQVIAQNLVIRVRTVLRTGPDRMAER